MSATVVFATPISSWSDAAAAAIRSRVACWASARALSSYLRFWVDIAFIEVYSLASRSLYTSFTERPHAMQTTTAPKIVGPHDGRSGSLGSIGVRFMIGAEETHAGGFSLVEHPMPPRALAAPLHLHTREDEYSYVLEGRLGALLGDDVVEAGPGTLVHKPRNEWHTFWNAGDEPCRILEIISPAGFEHFFRELVALGGAIEADPQELATLNDRYGLEMLPESVPHLLDRFGLQLGESLSGGWMPAAR